MNKFVKTGSRTGIVLSLADAALIAPEVIIAGPGCMHNQRMSQGYYPYSPMGPQMVYGQRTPYSYYPAPAPARQQVKMLRCASMACVSILRT